MILCVHIYTWIKISDGKVIWHSTWCVSFNRFWYVCAIFFSPSVSFLTHSVSSQHLSLLQMRFIEDRRPNGGVKLNALNTFPFYVYTFAHRFYSHSHSYGLRIVHMTSALPNELLPVFIFIYPIRLFWNRYPAIFIWLLLFFFVLWRTSLSSLHFTFVS